MKSARTRPDFRAPALLAATLVAACGTGAPGAAAGPKVPAQEARVNPNPIDLLAHLADHPDVVVEVATGIEHFQKGRVLLAIHGDGKAEIVNVMAGKERRFAHRLTAAEVKALGAEFAKAGFTTLRSRPGAREPGDSPVILRLLQGGKPAYEASLWYADRYDLPGLETILARYETIVTEATKGELPY